MTTPMTTPTTTPKWMLDLRDRHAQGSTATTARGIARAVRARNPEFRPAPAPQPAWDPMVRVGTRTRIPVPRLLDLLDGWQGRATARRLDDYSPLCLALCAAIAHGSHCRGTDPVAHCYGYPASGSCAQATRRGRAIMVGWERAHAGASGRNAYVHGWVDRAELMRAVALPRGWRWCADDHGVYVRGPHVTDYHPSAQEIADAIRAGSTRDIRLAARAVIVKRRAEKRAQAAQARTDRYDAAIRAQLARGDAGALGEIRVTVADSLASGNCAAGTDAWIAAHLPGRDSATVAEILAVGDRSEAVLRAVLRAVRRAGEAAAQTQVGACA